MLAPGRSEREQIAAAKIQKCWKNKKYKDMLVKERRRRIASDLKLTALQEMSTFEMDLKENQQVDRILGFLQESLTDTCSDFPKECVASNDNAESVFQNVKSKMIGQQIEIEEQNRQLILLKEEHKRLKQEIKIQQEQHSMDTKSKLNLQRKEYETIIKRHLTFIDNLLLEKQELTQKSQDLSVQVKTVEKNFLDKIKNLQEFHSKDLRNLKETLLASEKIKRDKWLQEKTKIIKEQTVKGLEPEIQRMLTQHKQNMRGLEEKLREEMLQEKNLLQNDHQRQLDGLKQTLSMEKQKACEDEREFARNRYQKQFERDEIEFQHQKRKIMAEFEEQKHTLLQTLREEKKQEQALHQADIELLRCQFKDEQKRLETSLLNQKKKHLQEMEEALAKQAIEKEQWQEMYMKKVESEIQQREKIFKEKLISDRDKEIEEIIEKLESETNSSASDITRKYRTEIEKVKAKMSEEIKQIRDEHSLALDKILLLQSCLDENEQKKRAFQKEILQLQNQMMVKDSNLKTQKDELTILKSTEGELSHQIKARFEADMLSKDAKIATLMTQIENLRKDFDSINLNHRKQIADLKRDNERTIAELEVQVRNTLALKQDAAKALKEKLQEAQLKNAHLEKLIEKQRKVR